MAISPFQDMYARGIYLGETAKYVVPPDPIPENAMRVGPGTDAVVWLICPSHSAEL